jgi:DNA-binding LacI/PurR family transcriptional regulator
MPRRSVQNPEARLLELVAAEAGKRLPSERELAERFGIGRPALRALLSDFAARRLIERRHGSGTYAIDRRLPSLNQVALIVDRRIRLGADPFFAAAVEALQGELQLLGASCQLLRYGEGGDAPAEAQLADAALMLGSACGSLLSRWNANTPVVAWLVAGETMLRRSSLIELEDAAAGASAVEYLLARGCTRLLFIGHDQHPSPRLRLGGAQAAAATAQVSLALHPSGMNYEDGIQAAEALSRESTSALGIIAANDWLAAGVHVGLVMRSCQVPVIGFDGLPLARALGLPSLAVPIPTIASDCVAELRRLIGNPAIPGRRLSYRLTLQEASPR